MRPTKPNSTRPITARTEVVSPVFGKTFFGSAVTEPPLPFPPLDGGVAATVVLGSVVVVTVVLGSVVVVTVVLGSVVVVTVVLGSVV